MPATKALSLSSAASVSNVLRYIYDENCESHKEYRIERDDGGPHDDFVAGIEEAVTRLNQEARPSNQIMTRAHWLIVRFPDGSDLNALERGIVHRSLVDGLGAGSPRWAWHSNRLNLGSDLNVVLPAVKPGLLPSLRRWISRSIWATAKTAMDRAVIALNGERRAAGRPPIPEMDRIQRAAVRLEDGRTLVEAMATEARDMKVRVSAATLLTLLLAVGLKSTDWSVEEDTIIFRRGRKRVRLRLDDLVAETAIVAVSIDRTSLAGSPHSPINEDIAFIDVE